MIVKEKTDPEIIPNILPACAWVLIAGLITHLPSLISDSFMWDDWIVLTWIRQFRLDWMFQFFHNYGVTPHFLVDLPFVLLLKNSENIALVAKLVYCMGVLLSSLLIMIFSWKLSKGNFFFSVLSGVFAASFPPISGEGFHLSMIFYHVFISLFLIGMIIFFDVSGSKQPILKRILGLVCLFLSFSLNSLLVFFYSLVPVILFYRFTQSEMKSKFFIEVRKFIFNCPDFLLLPIIFWIIKEVTMPRLGAYARYNALTIDISGIWHAYQQLIPNILDSTLKDPFSIPLMGYIAIGFGILFAIFWRFNSIRNDGTEKQYFWIIIFIFGLINLLAAALPYYLVGRRSFSSYGFMSRDNVLFSLPVSWMTAAVFCFILHLASYFRKLSGWPISVFGQRLIIAIISSLWLAQVAANWRNHIDWQAHYAYYRSVQQKIASNKTILDSSIIQVEDNLPGNRTLKGWKYPSSIWTEIVSNIFNETARFMVAGNPNPGPSFTAKEIEKYRVETEIQFMLEDIDFTGKQAKISITPTRFISQPIKLGITYWATRFFKPNELNSFLDSLTIVTTEKLS